MILTNDQYNALSKLEKWYNKYNHQIIEISGVVGTGIFQVIQLFIDRIDLDQREVMYLSYDQKNVLELAYRKFHAYYADRIIFNYKKDVDFNTLEAINPKSEGMVFEWKRKRRKHINPIYRLIVVFDSLMMDKKSLKNLCEFEVPIILIKDPMLFVDNNSYSFDHNPNIELTELRGDLLSDPIVLFANKILNGDKLIFGSYHNVSIIQKEKMNFYNLKYSDINISMMDDNCDSLNELYRKNILKLNNMNVVNEKLILMESMYDFRIVNNVEKKIKIYLTKGTVGNITKCNKHAEVSRYVPIEFMPEYYQESYTDISLDRYYLNNIDRESKQQVPDDIGKFKYGYIIPVSMSIYSHWDNVSILLEDIDDIRKLYTAITRARKKLTIIL